MSGVFPAADVEVLRRWHVGPAFFLELELPSGTRRFWDGAGNILADGHEWEGVTDAFGDRAVFVETFDAPELGTAPAVLIPIAAASTEFMAYMRGNDRVLEGVRATIYMSAFDSETGEQAFPLRALFPGFISGIKTRWEGVGLRTVFITLESILHGKNFTYGQEWSSTATRRRNAGDSGGDEIGKKSDEKFG